MESNTSCDDIYTEEGRRRMREDDEITLMEEAFMDGYAAAM